MVEPDSYVFDTHTNTIRSKTIGRKHIVLQADHPVGHSFAPIDQELLPVLNDTEARSLATLCNDVTREFGGPHEIAWAIDASGPAVLQIRPVEMREAGHRLDGDSIDGLVSGLGVGLGTASGPVRVYCKRQRLSPMPATSTAILCVSPESTASRSSSRRRPPPLTGGGGSGDRRRPAGQRAPGISRLRFAPTRGPGLRAHPRASSSAK